MELNLKEKQFIFGKVRITKYRAGTNEVVSQSDWMDNLIVNNDGRGKNLIAQRLVGVNTYSLNVTHGELGTSIGTPTAADTALGTPAARTTKALGSIGSTLNEAQLQFFWTDSQLANGTYYEFGTFVDGLSGTSTGQMFNHILFSTPYTKATGEDTTVEVDFTIS